MSEQEYSLKGETHQIIGCSMEVINELGHGFHEKIYENSLIVEFGLQDIPVFQQPEYPVVYKAANVGMYIPDLICFQSVVVDTKTIDKITDHEIGKMQHIFHPTFFLTVVHSLGANYKNMHYVADST